MKAAMFGDDASRCSNGLTAKKFREATPEERVIYRRWLRGAIVFYSGAVVGVRCPCGGELFEHRADAIHETVDTCDSRVTASPVG
jgi:hypothetical protein